MQSQAGVEQEVGSAGCKPVVEGPWWFDSTRRHQTLSCQALRIGTGELSLKKRAAGSTPALATIRVAPLPPGKPEKHSRPWSSQQDASSPSRRSRGQSPLAAPAFRRRVDQKKIGLLIRGIPWSVTTHADHTVAEGKEWSPLAVTQGLAGATPVSHPRDSGLEGRKRPACSGCRKRGVQVA
jgi:hypothetical protein